LKMPTNTVAITPHTMLRTYSVPQVKALAPSPMSAKRISELDGLRGLAILLLLIFDFGIKANSPTGHRWLSYLMDAGSLSQTGVNLFLTLRGHLFGGVLLKARNSLNSFIASYTRTFFRNILIYGDFVSASASLATPFFFDGVTI
jgi:peptidoglycan/LPS O-acetylase OafA/YrhL